MERKVEILRQKNGVGSEFSEKIHAGQTFGHKAGVKSWKNLKCSLYSQKQQQLSQPGLFSSKGARVARDMEGCYRDLSCFDQERKTINKECHLDWDGDDEGKSRKVPPLHRKLDFLVLE